MAALRAMLQLRSTSSSSQPASSTNNLLAYPDPSSLSLSSHFFSTSGGILQSSLPGPGSTGLAAAASTVGGGGGGGPPSILSSAASTNTMPTMSKPAQSKKVLNLGLHSGAACGNLGLVKFALDNGQAIDSVVNGVFPIHAASCSNANVAVVRYLIERGADVNARRLPRKYSSEKGVQTVGTTGSTPLHFAAANGCLAIVEILLRHGAIVDVIDKYGSSPLSVAAARNHPEVASLLHMHSCMQRGVQDMSPDIEIKDPFERRISGDFGQRLSPTGGRPTTNGPQKDTTQPLARPHATTTPATLTTTTLRVAGQRRISLPSIMESPNSPNPPAPRQSCDNTRLPHSTEPLVRSVSAMTESSRALGAPEPTTSSTKQQTPRPPQHPQKHQGPVLLPAHTLANSRLELPRSLQRSHTAHASQRKSSVAPASQGSASSQSTSENSIKRRRSMESTALLSPNSALGLRRRKSFDQLASILRSDSKTSLSSNITVTPVATTTTTTTTAPGSAPGSASGTIRRSSDASTSSHATNSSVTTADSVTTDNTSVSALSSPRCSQEGSEFLDKPRAAAPLSMAQHLVDSGVAGKTSPLTRSNSQPCMDKATTLRTRPSRPGLVTFASELETTFGLRPSLDISRLDLNRESERERERTGHHVRHQSTPAEKAAGDDDMDLEMPGQLFRRKTMQEQGTLPILLTPRYHSMGPTMEMGGGNSPNSDNGARSGANTPTDRRSLSRPPSPSMPRPSSAASGAYSTLSGSATVSGRFARMWSAAQSSHGIKDFSREGSGNGSAGWHVGEFAEATNTAAEHLVRSDSTRGGSTRGSMLNRLSGIWSRR
ncbi:hypothetical protein BG005_007654 [Podila minutissima]|nr:hypothetical protein BG005_007654 [Podila minutissima]